VNNGAPLRHFNLSQNKSLRTLETTVESIIAADDTAPDFLRTVLSSVTSPAPLDVVIIYRDVIPSGGQDCMWCCNSGPICNHSKEMRDKNARGHQQQLRVFREMRSMRDFRLVLCADVSDHMVGHAVGKLERIAKAEKVERGLGHLPYKSLVISERRILRTRDNDYHTGYSKKWAISACAL